MERLYALVISSPETVDVGVDKSRGAAAGGRVPEIVTVNAYEEI